MVILKSNDGYPIAIPRNMVRYCDARQGKFFPYLSNFEARVLIQIEGAFFPCQETIERLSE